MTIIKINGGFWGWEPIETLERLYPLFEQYTLDPIYEWYGNFVNRKPEWQRSEERQAYQGCTVISGTTRPHRHTRTRGKSASRAASATSGRLPAGSAD